MPFVLIFGCFLFVLRLCRRFLIIIVLEEIIIKIILEIVLEILKIIRRKETVDAVYRCSYSRYNTDNCKKPYYLGGLLLLHFFLLIQKFV